MGGCEPVFLTDLPVTPVGCVNDLPLAPVGEVLAETGCTEEPLEVRTFVVDATSDYTLNVGTTADGIGPDGAIRVFGLTALGLANSDYFVETHPLLVSRYANGLAVVSGQVQNVMNANLKWTVHMVLEDPLMGDEWTAEDPSHGPYSIWMQRGYGRHGNLPPQCTHSYLMEPTDQGSLATLAHAG